MYAYKVKENERAMRLINGMFMSVIHCKFRLQSLAGGKVKRGPKNNSLMHGGIPRSHPLVLDMPEVDSVYPSQNNPRPKGEANADVEAWKRRRGKFALATPESAPKYVWLPFLGNPYTLLTNTSNANIGFSLN